MCRLPICGPSNHGEIFMMTYSFERGNITKQSSATSILSTLIAILLFKDRVGRSGHDPHRAYLTNDISHKDRQQLIWPILVRSQYIED